ncbi:Uma2 family endonuclease [Nocardia sp. NPDC050378]|uniref:Uma2 family endonuclease n=1 Tax=Nocardia sp. NPDC050378 TaxID=3155400 RepID=UPI00340AFC53
MTVDPVHDWPIPPSGGFTVDDFLQMRDLPAHTELIDGGLVFVSPQRKWHSRVVGMLARELDAQAAPHNLRADREMAVRLGPRQMPEPDVVVVTGEAYARQDPDTYYFASDVIAAVEVVSPDSEERDRDTKPGKYAKANIEHYWRVECGSENRAVVYAYQLDTVTMRYLPIGIYHDRLKTSAPFAIDIDLTAID